MKPTLDCAQQSLTGSPVAHQGLPSLSQSEEVCQANFLAVAAGGPEVSVVSSYWVRAGRQVQCPHDDWWVDDWWVEGSLRSSAAAVATSVESPMAGLTPLPGGAPCPLLLLA